MDNTPAGIRQDPDALQSRTISYLRFLMAFAVVLLHASNAGAKGDLPVYSTMCILLGEGLCRIAVPCFFLISGYLFFKGLARWDWGVWTAKLKRRVHTLLIPYFLWNLLAAVLIYGYHWLRMRVGNGDAATLSEITSTWGSSKGWSGSKSISVDQVSDTRTRGFTIRAPSAKALMLEAMPQMG